MNSKRSIRLKPLVLACLVAATLTACDKKDEIPVPKTNAPQSSVDSAKDAAAKAVTAAKEAAIKSGQAARESDR